MAVKKGKEEAKKNESKAKSKVKEEVVETQEEEVLPETETQGVEEVEEDTPKKMPKRPKGYTKFQWTATQMNFIMKLNPAIEVESEEEDIINDIKDTATDQILSTDPFDKEAWEVFEELGITPITKEEETAEEEDTPKKKAKAEKKEKGEKKGRFGRSPSEGPSNKQIVYKTWKGGEEDPDKLHKKVNESVKRTTIIGWINQWKKGKNLPAGAD